MINSKLFVTQQIETVLYLSLLLFLVSFRLIGSPVQPAMTVTNFQSQSQSASETLFKLESKYFWDFECVPNHF